VTIHLENQALILQTNTEHLIAADQESSVDQLCLGHFWYSEFVPVKEQKCSEMISSVIVIGYYYYT
jgi:hypothetical protein